MATTDVPGANKSNGDALVMGCWAEHEDKSLIFVEATEMSRVVFSLFDVSRDPAMEFRDAMPDDEFKKTFSWPNVTGEKWTWHDKTPFPWDRVMQNFPSGARVASASALGTAARRIAERLGLRGRDVDDDSIDHLRDQMRSASSIISGIQRALDRLRP